MRSQCEKWSLFLFITIYEQSEYIPEKKGFKWDLRDIRERKPNNQTKIPPANSSLIYFWLRAVFLVDVDVVVVVVVVVVFY